MIRNESHRLKQLQRSYLMLRLLEVICLGVGAGLVLLVAGQRAGLGSIDSLVLAGTVAVVIILQRAYSLGLHQLSQQRMASFVNRYYPSLEWSTDLLVTDQPLTGLQLLQREKALAQLPALSSWRFPHQLMTGVSALIVGLLLFVFVGNEPPETSEKELQVASASDREVAEQPQPVVIKNISGTVNAPAYTGLRTVAFKSPDIKAAEGSVVNWKVEFSSAPERALIVFSGADSLSLKSDKQWFSGDTRVVSTGFYQVVWLDADEWKASDFYKLEVVRDLPPQLAVRNLPQFQQFDWDEIEKVNVKADLSDDYGLKDAYLVATVAKGSGESVKFREEKLLFEKPTAITGKRVGAERTIDLKKMGLEPGDELYFYVEAWDNKSPVQQTERTETYFLQLNDTASYLVSNDGGLGVDLMPEYFRSQRQIIIDSEKLVAQRGKLEKELFDNTSNGLAHDQKVLRLRYGQFMGEEFESGGVEVQEHEEQEEPAAPTDVEEAMKQFGHAHDTENEHNLVPASEEEHDHEDEEENPLEAFAHMHDSQEEATFFIQSVKTKLRAALSLMWDAELHLRMNSPEESLPYQYKILKLLKEISNDSRIYVHRTGFDPPPIKEEKRLTGDLEEINPAKRRYSSEAPQSFPNARKALALIEKYIQTSSAIPTTQEKEVLQLAGSEMAQQAIEFPGKYLQSMSLLKSLTDQNEETSKVDLIQIRKALWELIPAEVEAPALISNPVHTLDQQLLNRMEAND